MNFEASGAFRSLCIFWNFGFYNCWNSNVVYLKLHVPVCDRTIFFLFRACLVTEHNSSKFQIRGYFGNLNMLWRCGFYNYLPLKTIFVLENEKVRWWNKTNVHQTTNSKRSSLTHTNSDLKNFNKQNDLVSQDLILLIQRWFRFP